MKLTVNSWHYKAYQLLTGNTPNNNFCDYFWTLVLNVFTLPITFPYYLIISVISLFPRQNREWKGNSYTLTSKTYKEKFIEASEMILFGKFLISAVLFIFSMCFITYTLKTIIGVCFLALVIGFFILLDKFDDSDTKYKITNNIQEIAEMTGEAWLSFKGKYCPKIEWKEIKD